MKMYTRREFSRGFNETPDDDDREFIITSVVLPPDLRRRVERVAQLEGATLSGTIRGVLEAHLEEIRA